MSTERANEVIEEANRRRAELEERAGATVDDPIMSAEMLTVLLGLEVDDFNRITDVAAVMLGQMCHVPEDVSAGERIRMICALIIGIELGSASERVGRRG